MLLLTLAPLISYQFHLSLIGAMPQKPKSSQIEKSAFKEDWASIEPNLSAENVDDITPYWIYRWLLNLNPYKYSSVTAYQVSLHYLRESDIHSKVKGGMLRWHLMVASLSIWLQRNWAAEELLAKHNEFFPKQNKNP